MSTDIEKLDAIMKKVFSSVEKINLSFEMEKGGKVDLSHSNTDVVILIPLFDKYFKEERGAKVF